jgi:cation:H+ antiporter
MIIISLILFLACLVVLVQSADYAARYSSRLARAFQLSEFVVSFFIVAVISTFPEGTISIVSALKGMPEIGLGTLLGSNVADLALVFGIVTLFSANGIRVKSEILKKNFYYLALLLFPILLGLDGHFSRIDGILLVLAGLVFFFTLSIESGMFRKDTSGLNKKFLLRDAVVLIMSLVILIISANYTIKYCIQFAGEMNIPAVIISLTMLSIGVCLPELCFSLRAVKHNHDGLALGDLLGTVVTDATIILGITALIRPFSFDPMIIYLTGTAMFIAGLLAVLFITTGKMLTKKEGIYLIFFYLIYLFTALIVSRI